MNARRRQAARRSWPTNLYQNTKGYFWFRNPENGKTVGLGYELEKAKRQVKLANLEMARRREDRDLVAATSESKKTLRSFCSDYEKDYASEGKKNTLNAIKSSLNAIRADERSEKALDQFTPKDAADMIKAAVKERGPWSAKVMRRRLEDVFRDAIQHGLIKVGQNPVASVLKPKTRVKRARMTEADFALFLKHAETPLQNAMMLALITGQRISDVQKMRFDDARDGFLWVEQKKGGKRLKIPLSVMLNGTTLGTIVARCRDRAASQYLVHFSIEGFQTKRGAQVSQKSIGNALRRARAASEYVPSEGLEPTSFHEIRSLSARLHKEQNGADFAQAILGHSTAAMTELYTDVRGQQWIEVKTGTH
ncbi:tyrosine-type recombinase/integrase [Caballeronia sp. LjRoot34]|uniref:tyrosine-type recombinase/integrase n=1 Tax=Caballeronia sp. LjRoot34 TaxID=3342325 RepID=UPI003ECE2180